MTTTASPLHQPLRIRGLELPNRIAMSPMTRTFSPGGVPTEDVAQYYRRRAEGGTGLIVTEGVGIDHPSAIDHPDVPNMHTPAARDGWRRVVDQVHEAGGRIVPQLWHVGPLFGAMTDMPHIAPMRPSGVWGTPGVTSYPQEYVDRAVPETAAMTEDDIAAVIAAYADAARTSVELGFDGIAIHGGHGYLLDSFLWSSTNLRDDAWGGDLQRRTAFPVAVVRAIREAIGDDLPIVYRFSQHKQQDFTARIAETPEELGLILGAIVDAGADVLDASSRRFDAPAFEGSDLSLAGWAKKTTGAITMSVGCVGLGKSLRDGRLAGGSVESVDNIAELERRIGTGEFDLAAIGRLHLADPRITETLRNGGPLPTFDRAVHESVLT
ncbi:oxidoreductase [Rhodococcus tukisamuensis]|uniref:2,4-dienoyl-CoA reductase n=1 Tax=Rhodococcus tukisamuensis TaxID=168276 RepID=A0A1G6NUM7_9NOCA|nr:12-oxophytodienoate reductase [Rhodococcus tukisamuensis]SDC70875.1 2,4-dienoyl-CoA reductase [Rhodococcus tukisamuensis]